MRQQGNVRAIVGQNGVRGVASSSVEEMPGEEAESRFVVLPVSCTHGRLIDDVIRRGRRTGMVRCLECGVTFQDPYQGIR